MIDFAQNVVVMSIYKHVGHLYGIVSAKRDLTHTLSNFNRNVTPALKCMANLKFRALQLHDGYSDSQCVRSNV